MGMDTKNPKNLEQREILSLFNILPGGVFSV